MEVGQRESKAADGDASLRLKLTGIGQADSQGVSKGSSRLQDLTSTSPHLPAGPQDGAVYS